MKLLQEILNSEVVREERVASKSEKGVSHSVKLYKDGTMDCGCVHGWNHRRTMVDGDECRHKLQKRVEWHGDEGWRWELE